MNKYIAVSSILIIFSLITLFNKGYFSVRKFNSNREDITKYLEKKYQNKIPVFNLDKDILSEDLHGTFSDVKNVSISRNFDFSVTVNVENRLPFAKVNRDKMFISTEGYLYTTSSNPNKEGLPVYLYSNEEVNSQLLSADALKYIEKIKLYPHVEIKRIDNSSFILTSTRDYYPTIKIEKGLTNLPNMITPTNTILEKIETKEIFAHYLIVLNNKIVIKETVE